MAPAARGETPISDQEPEDRGKLDDLDRRLAAARARRGGGHRDGDESRGEGMGIGMRIAVELVAGVAIGAVIGIVLDRWLGTAPWLLILFFFLGTCGGFLNVYRTAQEYERRRRDAGDGRNKGT